MIIAMQTGTDFPSYPHSKIGSRGWFFAGNDLSALFAIMFPIVVLYSIYKTTSFSKIYYWIPTILAMYASIMVGTKVGYGAIVLTLGVALFFSFIEYMINRKRKKRIHISCKHHRCSSCTRRFNCSYTAYSYRKNMGIHMQIYEYKNQYKKNRIKRRKSN